MRSSLSLALLVLVTIAGLALWVLTFTAPSVPIAVPLSQVVVRLPAPLLALPGLIVGPALLILSRNYLEGELLAFTEEWKIPLGVVALAVLGAGLLWAVKLNQLTPVKAALIAPLAVVTLVLAFETIAEVRRNDGLSFENNWGGVGGGLGGWRLSTAAVLTVLLLLFTSATIGVALYDPKAAPPETPGKSKPGKEAAEKDEADKESAGTDKAASADK
jgi:hypothetical protein